jgi:hypothetical protein
MRLFSDSDRRANAHTQPFQYGSPEEALVAWLIMLPDGVDPARAARAELEALARTDDPGLARIRELLAEVGRFSLDEFERPDGAPPI